MIKYFSERPSTSIYIDVVWQAEVSGLGNHILPAKGSWDLLFTKKKLGAQTFLIAPTGSAQTERMQDKHMIENMQYVQQSLSDAMAKA